ncbi:Plasmodium exported protein (Pm-fam-a like), unknown function [Plasmodium ovale wallikeri]|uniref:Pv-fam-b protein n=2 Tax=Plasmodium ovale TaxID=36330 RepID=A0A1A9A8T8_PLAOA|nr:Plasmodium exported protein (Pm-fam-a like), unknown function [Plasmodium ovale wallikeri]SBT55580.1 Plasmodium exported protein (Pm-fam-a like), unknown function [Plasmodium ovale wallikeri]SBT75592.1 Plasmodium exported protein, unknown function [Plasmodium ovale]
MKSPIFIKTFTFVLATWILQHYKEVGNISNSLYNISQARRTLDDRNNRLLSKIEEENGLPDEQFERKTLVKEKDDGLEYVNESENEENIHSDVKEEEIKKEEDEEKIRLKQMTRELDKLKYVEDLLKIRIFKAQCKMNNIRGKAALGNLMKKVKLKTDTDAEDNVEDSLEKIKSEYMKDTLKLKEIEEKIHLVQTQILENARYSSKDPKALLKEVGEKIHLMQTHVLDNVKHSAKYSKALLKGVGENFISKKSHLVGSVLSSTKEGTTKAKALKKSIFSKFRSFYEKDSYLEKKLFKIFCYVDKCENDPNITQKAFNIIKLKKYGPILGVPFSIILLGFFGFIDASILYPLMFVCAGIGFAMFMYILAKTLKYDISSYGITNPGFKEYVASFKRCIA